MDNDQNKQRWLNYYNNREKADPRELVKDVLSLFESEKIQESSKLAIELGCGSGLDTAEMINNFNWSVTAFDYQEEGLTRTKGRIHKEKIHKLTTLQYSFEDIADKVELPQSTLLYSAYALPFCSPNKFPQLMEKVKASISVGGRFTGNFFGLNDAWNDRSEMTFLSSDQVKSLFNGFNIEYFDEFDGIRPIASGESKHWHVLTIRAKKI